MQEGSNSLNSSAKSITRKAKLPKPPSGRRPIGFRGNHCHGKPLYDPVYPTSKIPTRLVPRYPIDWKNGGRAIITCCMSLIADNRRIHRHKKSLKYENPGCFKCQERCTNLCSSDNYYYKNYNIFVNSSTYFNDPSQISKSDKSKIKLEKVNEGFHSDNRISLPDNEQKIDDSFFSSSSNEDVGCSKCFWRCLCSWRINDYHQHIINVDNLLFKFKGFVELTCDENSSTSKYSTSHLHIHPFDPEKPNNVVTKPIFTIPRQVARKNSYKSEAMDWDDDIGMYIYSKRFYINPSFDILPHHDPKKYLNPHIESYDSNDETSDSEVEIEY